ncbi:hypothetical protein VDGL01_07435 [Verticillium dahliae]
MGGSQASIFSRSGRSPLLTPSTHRPDPASCPDGNGRPPRLDKIACFPRHERQKETIASINFVWDLDCPTDPSIPRPNCALSCLFVFLPSTVGERPGWATPSQWEERQIRTGKRTARWKSSPENQRQKGKLRERERERTREWEETESERPTKPLRLICIPSPMSQSHPWTRHPGPPQG